jgi:hypothetical protein
VAGLARSFQIASMLPPSYCLFLALGFGGSGGGFVIKKFNRNWGGPWWLLQGITAVAASSFMDNSGMDLGEPQWGPSTTLKGRRGDLLYA